MICISILLSLISAVLYRIGGSSLKIPNITKIRDCGVPFLGCTIVAINHWPLHLMAWLGLILSFGLAWGSMTSYFKRKGSDAVWWNWMLVGLAFGIAFLPYAWATGLWFLFIYRTIATTIFVVIWSESISNAMLEELGRGFIFSITLLIL